ncbi:lamin tail domain-containing protein [Arthrobacter sp. Sa2BUA2]|uniref:Lamin tail domain-containing protein n=1 Tax=Arthrobacter pullicola TaxID=2762224 RepID=A0ABR8YLR5_9MICC|nr:lamin tail domain-containing protein [Arthrobacter pullicola]MBD8045179.1 lamin tail domain-containing protein [Arthrobacter pullicola]
MPAQAALPLRFDVQPGSDVLISEVANGGAGANPQSNRAAARNFIEITNYGSGPMDISGWKIFRCGQTGGGYGPQAVIPDGTVLSPGDQFTAARDTSGYTADAFYGTSLHDFGFGAFLEDAGGQRVDAVGFYHPDVATDCELDGKWLHRSLQHRLDESHQRVSNTGDLEQDWVIATRTVDAPNATASTVKSAGNGLRVTELTNSGSASTSDQYVEVTNLGDAPVDMSGYQLFRCGENGTQYLQVGAVASGSVVQPGASFLFAHAAGAYRDQADATYATGMHWRDFGAMLLTADDEIVDGVGAYDNRNSSCTTGAPVEQKLNAFDNEVYHRVSDTGNNAVDFAVTTARTPGTHDPGAVLETASVSEYTDVAFSELTAAGPQGSNDEFVEIANYGSAPVNLSGFSAHRCYGTGQPGLGAEAQVADLGDVVLHPGQTYLMAPASAPAELRAAAQATYATGLNQADGYGMYLTDPDGARVDAVAVYDLGVNAYTPCRQGEEVRNYTKFEEGGSVTRARHTGDNENDYAMASRTPGVLQDAVYVDPALPLPGELDPVSLPANSVPGTPAVSGGEGNSLAAEISVSDADGGQLEVSTRVAPVLGTDKAVVRAGISSLPVPLSLQIEGEQVLPDARGLETPGTATGFPFQRFEIPVDDAAAEFVWSGTTEPRNEIQLLAWTGTAWEALDAAVPSADGNITLTAPLPAAALAGGTADVLVIDGPRTTGGLLEEGGVTDQAFADPSQYDFAVNHMTDTQFYSEGFRDVFRRMTSWVVANADARKIEYNSLTGDIIENWINGNNSAERANREFQSAQDIMGLLNDANVPNGVLPGNHDNMWGHNNDKYNEYFPVSMYEGKDWYGEAWAAGDNSAHTDYFSAGGVDFLVINLPYRSSDEQMAWAAQQAAAHPDHNVILATHSYIHTSAVRDNIDLRYTATGEELWNTVVAPNDNVFLVLGGHFHGTVTNYADPVTGGQVDATDVANQTYAISNVGATGRTVVEMLADYQGYRSTLLEDPAATRSDLLDRDTGFQRLLQFDLDAGLMAVNAYSPTLDSFEAWKYDEPAFRGDAARYDASDDEFVAAVSLLRSTTLSTGTWALTGAGSVLETVQLESGKQHSVKFEPAAADRLWFVEAADPSGNMVRSVPRVLTGTGDAGQEPDPTPTPEPNPEPTTPAPDPSPTRDPEPTPAPSAPAVPGPTGPGAGVILPGAAAPQPVPSQRSYPVWPAGTLLPNLFAPAGGDSGEETGAEEESAGEPEEKAPAGKPSAAPRDPSTTETGSGSLQAEEERADSSGGLNLGALALGAAAVVLLAGAGLLIARRRGFPSGL